MSDYRRVSEALKSGAEPRMLCQTCPWDRHCITPPSMTSAEVEAEIEKAKRKDDEQMLQQRMLGEKPGMPTGMLLTAIAIGGKDTSASICPVYALRLRSSQGLQMAQSTRALMQSWDDSQ